MEAEKSWLRRLSENCAQMMLSQPKGRLVVGKSWSEPDNGPVTGLEAPTIAVIVPLVGLMVG